MLKNLKPAGLVFLIISATTLHAQSPSTDLIHRVEIDVPIKNIRSVGGFIGDRLQKNKDHYLALFPIEDYVLLTEQRNFNDWDWRKGEQTGKWLESSLLTAERTHDTALDAKVHTMFTRLINSQEPEGYIGITARDARTADKPLRGMDAYELYFLQHALLTASEEWQDKKALAAAQKLGDYFIRYIGPGKAEFWPTKDRYPDNMGKVLKGTQHSDIAGHSIHYSWEGTLLIDPMLRLYQQTGEKKYLDWCKWVISRIDIWSGWNAFSRLDSVAAGTMTIDKIQPYVHAHTFQMNFLGFLRMYQVTGDTAYLRKVEGAWDDVEKRQAYITGGVSVGEHYERDYIKPLTGKMIETCATMSWLQLSQYLLELTGNTKYADAMERVICNQVFAGQTSDGDCSRYNTPPNGFKPDGYFRTDGPDCCTGSGHRLLSILPGFIYATKHSSIFVNQYIPSSAVITAGSAGQVTLEQKGDLFTGDKISITVNPKQSSSFTINVRIPAWCNPGMQVWLNGKEYPVIKPVYYAAITRVWKAGDKIELRLPMQLQWVRHDNYLKTSDKKPYTTTEDSDAPWALQKGPLVYAVDNMYYRGDTAAFPKNVMNDVKYILGDPSRFATVPAAQDMAGPGYRVPVVLANGRQTTMDVFPFANIGKWYPDPGHKPAPGSQAYSYAIWLKGIKQ